MNRTRSPNYPAIPLEQAIDYVGQIHSKSRTNVIDRESAAKDMGYSGLTGRSFAILGALSQFQLVARAGKGDLRVTPLAVDILHGLTAEDRIGALAQAGRAPKLFQAIFNRFTDGVPSENVIRSYLIQQGYADGAINAAIKSFTETNQYLEKMGVTDGHGPEGEAGLNEPSFEDEDEAGLEMPTPQVLAADHALVPVAAVSNPPAPPVQAQGGYRTMEGERVVFSEETGADGYLKLIASGPLDDSLLEALEDYIRRQRKRLGSTN